MHWKIRRQRCRFALGLRPLVRRTIRPQLEPLETRLALANVDVLSWHNDNSLTGANTREEILTPADVNPTQFGRLFSYAIDGYAYAQPLYKADLAFPGMGKHNAVFAATEHDSVYAFDADGGGMLWQRTFLDPAAGITAVPRPDITSDPFIGPEFGITGTPVIDGTTNTMYVVAFTKEVRSGMAHYVVRLHALDITTGQDRGAYGDVTIGDSLNDDRTHVTDVSVSGTGAGSEGGIIRFNVFRQLQRPALTLANGFVYIAWAGQADTGPYHGWVLGYRTNDLTLQKVFNSSPDARGTGIWESGGGLAVDPQYNLYFADGNGFGANAYDGLRNWSESVLKLSTTGPLTVADSFTPFNWRELDAVDQDLGSGGMTLLPEAVGSAAHTRLTVETGKEGKIYLLDRDDLGGYRRCGQSCDDVVSTLVQGVTGVWGNPAFFQDSPTSGIIYYHGSGDVAKAFRVANGMMSRLATTNTVFGFPGGQPSISANGTSDAIDWELQVDAFATQSGHAILYAYNATTLGELYRSNQTSLRDQAANGVKFTVPTVSNGHVYVGTQSVLEIYGLFDDNGKPPDAAPTNLKVRPSGETQLVLTWTNNAGNATGVKILRSTNGQDFSTIATVARNVSTFTDTGLMPSTRYYYRVQATNQHGDSLPSETASAITGMPDTVLTVTDVSASAIHLAWTGVADDHYDVQRSTDGIKFTLAGTVPANGISFRDDDQGAGLGWGTYFYRVDGVNADGSRVPSNTARATIGPDGTVHSDGFDEASDLHKNGSADFVQTLARLAGDPERAGSVFTTAPLGIRAFTTTFTFRIHEGSDPRGEGFTFLVQADSRGPGALGLRGSGLGYQGIRRSVAIKFDIFDNAGEGPNSTGIFTGGRPPTVRSRALPPDPTPDRPDRSVDLRGTDIELNNQHTKRVTLTYDGATLEERIEDIDVPAEFTVRYDVDIAGILGSDTAYVGFTGGTSAHWTIMDVQTWTYEEADESGFIPRRPSTLTASGGRPDVMLDWLDNNAYTAQGYVIERSADTPTQFKEIARIVDPNLNSYRDTPLGPGVYYYRVRSFNDLGDSPTSNQVRIGGAGGNPGAGGLHRGNSAAAISNTPGSTGTISNPVVINNNATGDAGGVGSSGGNGQGIGIYDRGPSSITGAPLTIHHSTIVNNRANWSAAGTEGSAGLGQGGGISIVSGGTVCVDRVTNIRANHASTNDDDVFGDLTDDG